MNRLNLTVLLIAILLFASLADAQTTLVVVGSLKDTADQPIEGNFTINVQNKSRQIEATGKVSSAGRYKVIFFAGVLGNLEAVVAETGEVLEISALDPGGEVVATQNHQLTSDDLARATVVVDLTFTPSEPALPPDAGLIVVSDPDLLGNRIIRGGRGAVIGGVLIRCIYQDGSIATARSNLDGSFFLTVPATVAGDGFDLTVIDAEGQESAATRISTTVPNIPTERIVISEPDPDGQVRIDGSAGAVAGGSILQCIYADGSVITATANPDGSFSLSADAAILGVGFDLIVTDAAGEIQTSTRLNTGAPTTGIFYVTGGVRHPDGSPVPDGIEVTVRNEVTGTTLSNLTGQSTGEGRYVVQFFDPETNRAAAVGDVISVRAADAQGNATVARRTVISSEFEAFSMVVDLTLPTPDTVLAPIAGIIVVSEPDAEGNLTIRGAQGAVIGNGLIRCIYQDGSVETARANTDGSFLLTVVATVAGDGFDLTVTDAAGVESEVTRISTTVPKIPRESIIVSEPDAFGRVTISAEAGTVAGGSFLRCIYADGSVITIVTNTDGSFSLTANEETLGIGFDLIVTDIDGNVLATGHIRTIAIVPTVLSIDFGDVLLDFGDAEVMATLSIRNVTPMDIAVTDITSTLSETLAISETVFTVPAGETHEVTLTWTPTEKGRVTDTLSFVTDYPNLLPTEVAITGNAIKIDVNSDGVINIFDLVLVGSQFGKPNPDPNADVNNDGVVNIFDLVAIGSNFGQGAAAPSVIEATAALTRSEVDIETIRQALAELEAIDNPSRGALVAKEFLRAWLGVVNPLVTETKLLPNYPNPFNPETWIPFELAADAEVTIILYAPIGRLIRTLSIGFRSTGRYISRGQAIYWDGRNNAGERVASGVYFYRFQAGDYQATRKMILMK